MRVRRFTALVLAVACLALAAPSFGQDSKSKSPDAPPADSGPDFNNQIYYRNKLEFSFDTGCLFYNTPLILDPIMGARFARVPDSVNYTLVPLDFALRWHLYDIRGRSFWRGNTDLALGGSYIVITQGPESRYVALIGGARYNFVQPNWRIAPYLELRGGLGLTNAKQPEEVARGEVPVGQGQDFTFTFIMGTGIRYNFNSRYSMSIGVAFQHISNGGLSTPKYYNHGINVVGPTVGFNVAL